MSLETLKKLLPPPKNPCKPGDEKGWRLLEHVLGTALPKDYKAFIGTYGTGGIDDFLWFLTPFEADENVNLLKRTQVLRDSYLELQQKHPDYYQHAFFPDEGGLMPWGYTDNGDELYWLTKGEPEEWPIVAYESRSSDYEVYHLTLTDFIAQIVSKEVVCEVFPDDFPAEAPEFISVDVE